MMKTRRIFRKEPAGVGIYNPNFITWDIHRASYRRSGDSRTRSRI